MYNSRVKNRKIKKILNYLINIFKFKSVSISKAKQTALVWIFTWYLSLFLNWINSSIKNFNSNVFNEITWFSWVVIFILLTILLFIILSTNSKERLKITSNISFDDYKIIKAFSIIIILLSLNSLYAIIWLNIFSSDISYWIWVIVSFASAIVILISSFAVKKDTTSNKNFYLNDSTNEKVEIEEKNNMKLPF